MTQNTKAKYKNKIIITFFIILPIVTFSQQLSYQSGGTVYNSENVKLSPNDVRNLLATNTETLALFNSGRNKKTWGNILFYGGLGLITTNVVVAATTYNMEITGHFYDPISGSTFPKYENKSSSMAVAAIGGALVAISIPIKIGYPKKIKQALSTYNSSLTANYIPTKKLAIIANTNQFGFRYEF
jgi:hypothetical protein